MARLASGAKLGYYPTPENVCTIIRRILDIQDEATALDPCCGTGEALVRVTEGAHITRYGIELDEERYRQAEKVLDVAARGDALREMSIRGRFDLVFLNPPYDWEDGERLETTFFKAYMPKTALHGVIVHVVPIDAIVSTSSYETVYAGMLARFSTELAVCRFPDGQFTESFRQIVIFQRLGRATQKRYTENKSLLDAVAQQYREEPTGILPIDSDTLKDFRFRVNARGLKVQQFKSTHIPTARLKDLSSRMSLEEFFTQVEVPALINTVPLAPLRTGHLAMLVTSGLTNGLKIETPEGFMVIKGVVDRGRVVIRDDEDTTVSREAPKMKINVLFVNNDGTCCFEEVV